VAAAVDATTIDANARGIKIVAGGVEGLKVFGNEEQVRAASPTSSRTPSRTPLRLDRAGIDEERRRDGRAVGRRPGHRASRPTSSSAVFERSTGSTPARHRLHRRHRARTVHRQARRGHPRGEIRVWSVEGQGSTFTLTLPRANQEVQI
jgi:two-component system sensor histidine kinase SenX3